MRMKEKYRGQITVFLSLILICVCGLICGLLESARTAAARCYIEIAAVSITEPCGRSTGYSVWSILRNRN